MATRLPTQQTDVIVLSSDSEDDSDFDQPSPRGSAHQAHNPSSEIIYLDDDWTAALTAADGKVEFQSVPPVSDLPETVTEDDCLQKILDVFPDVAHDHVRELFNEPRGTVPDSEWCDHLIMKLLDSGPYPKEREVRKNLKRKRSDSDDEDAISQYEKMDRNYGGVTYSAIAAKLLQDEFLDIPVKHIQNTIRTVGTLFRAYFILDQQHRDYNPLKTNPFSKVRLRVASKQNDSGDSTMDYVRADLLKEISAARKKRQKDDAQRKEDAKQASEAARRALEDERKLEIAKANGEAVECGCCCGDFPPDHMIYCDGDNPHLFCRECARQHVETLVGMSKCRPTCMSMEDCGATFTRQQLKIFLNKGTFERLERMQQQEDILAAGIEDLEECPFCEFKAECPPVEIDREFRCRNPECERVSCRLCQLETHIPQTCAEFAKENKLSIRHILEEAMTNALKRNCNKCKKPFVKSDGCNKMVCTNCQNKQCYVCSKNVVDYNHFKEGGPCPLHDNTDARHIDEVKKAETEALAKIRAENPDLTEDDLKIQVSDRVRREEEAREKRAQAAVPPGAPQQYYAPPPPLPRFHEPFMPALGARREPLHQFNAALAPGFPQVHPNQLLPEWANNWQRLLPFQPPVRAGLNPQFPVQPQINGAAEAFERQIDADLARARLRYRLDAERADLAARRR